MIVSAGIKQFGTEAAGRVLADPAALDPLLRKLPWRVGKQESSNHPPHAYYWQYAGAA